MNCVECGALSQGGIMQHSKECSANNWEPKIQQELHPPTTQITFENEEERKKFYDNLSGGSGQPNPNKE